MDLHGSHEASTDAPERIPGLLSLLWMLLWRPVDLHYRLHGAGIRSPGGRVGQLWSEQGYQHHWWPQRLGGKPA